MGYRLRLGKVTKEDWNKLYKDKTQEDIIKQFGNGDNDNYFAFAYPPQHIQLYELGKYVDFKNDEFTPFYSFELDDSEFWIVSKKGLLSIIEQYRQDTQKYYQKLIKSFENKTEDMHEKIISHFIYKNNIWNNKFEELHPYYLDQKKQMVLL